MNYCLLEKIKPFLHQLKFGSEKSEEESNPIPYPK